MAKGKYHEWLTEEGLLKIEGWARDGLIDEQIAHNIGITTKTLYEWKNKYSEICEALKRGKEVVDREVENALFKSAIGYDYEEVTYEYSVELQMKIPTKTIKRHMPPNPTSMIFWLKNRKPDTWRDKQDIDANVDSTINIKVNINDAD